MTTGYNGYIIVAGPNNGAWVLITGSTMSGGAINNLVYHMNLDQDEHHIYGSARLGVCWNR